MRQVSSFSEQAASTGDPHAHVPAYAVGRLICWILVAFGILRTEADPDLWGDVPFGLDRATRRPGLTPRWSVSSAGPIGNRVTCLCRT